jgi:hypothetical protein
MKGLVSQLGQNEKSSFSVGQLLINYPGYKKVGDYKLTINGVAPTHTNVVRELYNAANEQNLAEIIAFLDDVYTNGLKATSAVFPKTFIEKIYWITLQEEINYPPPRKGRKLPFQRFYEGALAKVVTGWNIAAVERRANNHGSRIPSLFPITDYAIPSFYC